MPELLHVSVLVIAFFISRQCRKVVAKRHPNWRANDQLAREEARVRRQETLVLGFFGGWLFGWVWFLLSGNYAGKPHYFCYTQAWFIVLELLLLCFCLV